MARKVFEVAGQKYIVIAYTGFAELGLATEPPRPLAAVPLFDRVEDSLVEPLRRARSVEEDFKVMGFRGVGGLLRAMAGESVASAPPQGNGRLSYEDKSVCPFVLFRGERSYEFSIMPTSYRPLAHIPAERHPRIRRRHTRIERRLARKIRAAVLISRRSWLTRLQSRAAARHFGAVSTLADFTFDPRVAAYFAHPTFNEADRTASGAGTRPVGIIYEFRYDKLQRCLPIQTFSTEESGAATFTFQVITDVVEVPYLAFDATKESIYPARCLVELPLYLTNRKIALRSVLVPTVARIRAQQAAFLEIAGEATADCVDSMRLWYLLDFICDKWCFFRSDRQYEEPPSITRRSFRKTRACCVWQQLAPWVERTLSQDHVGPRVRTAAHEAAVGDRRYERGPTIGSGYGDGSPVSELGA